MNPPLTAPLAISRRIEGETPPAEWIARFVAEIPTGVAVFDRELRYIAANPSWADAFGFGVPPAGQRHDELDPRGGALLVGLQRRALTGETAKTSAVIDDNGGGVHRTVTVRPRRGHDGAVVGVVAALHESTTTTAARARHAGLDHVTGIAGRNRFLDRVRAAVRKGARSGAAMFLLDIANFKGVNDLYGARVGDAVLKAIAARLSAGIRSQTAWDGGPDGTAVPREADLVARLGADEFGLVLGAPAPTPVAAEAFARRLLAIVESPVSVGELRLRLTANVGFIITGPAHRRVDDVLRDLNIALQEAKAHGPSSARAWEPALTSTVGRRLIMLDQLRRALDQGEFVLHYQPILDLASGRVVGAEALLRWNHPSDGLVAPGDFLPLLEQSGLIVPVGCWVIREVARQSQVWQMLYGRKMIDWVAVNVSPRQFNDPAPLLATLREIGDSGFPLDRLKIEITESAVMREPEVTKAVLGQLRDLGIRVALDDFGTGYSALGALRHYSVDTIKIDRDFTTRLDTEDGRELVMALLRIARIYGAAVVAEGVETAAQRDILHDAGCDLGQGYLFARPMDGGFFGAYALTHLVDAIAAK